MRSPSSEEILAIWEAALADHPLDRALTIAAAFSHQPKSALARLPIGMRDSLLFQARASLFGPTMDTYSECPTCSGPVEFAVEIAKLPLQPCGEHELEGAAATVYETVAGVSFRLPNSFDLAAIALEYDSKAAEQLLVRRCIAKDDLEVDQRIVEDVSRAIAERDPAGDLEFEVACPNCGVRWTLILDIGSFFWREMNSYAKRLLSEVDSLARAYGWQEKDILNLSAARREVYLQMVAGV